MLANYVASRPLLSESWTLCCNIITTTNPSIQSESFVMKQVGSIGYVAFPSIISEAEAHICCNGNLVPMDDQFFSPLNKQINEGEEDPVLVHAGFLQLFFSIYASPSFQTQVIIILYLILYEYFSLLLNNHNWHYCFQLFYLFILGLLPTNLLHLNNFLFFNNKPF